MSFLKSGYIVALLWGFLGLNGNVNFLGQCLADSLWVQQSQAMLTINVLLIDCTIWRPQFGSHSGIPEPKLLGSHIQG